MIPLPPVLRGEGEREPVTVGGLRLSNPLLLAPLAGVTIPSIRLFYSRLGAGGVHTEMVSGAGLLRSNRKTTHMLAALPGEAPLILQLFAGDEATLLSGAERALEERPFPALGINMACPMPKVLKKGAGSRLLERPEVAFEMVRSLAALGLPVWPKIRKCPPSFPLSTEAFCEGLLNAGAALVTIHGRTPAARYSGEADRTIVGSCAALFPEKICASGDVYTPEHAAGYLDQGCAAVMLARGALADPFLFPRTLAFLGHEVHNSYRNPSPDFQVQLLLSFGDLICAEEGQKKAVLFLKRLLAGMFKGERGVGALRRDAASHNSWAELRGLLAEWTGYFERRD